MFLVAATTLAIIAGSICDQTISFPPDIAPSNSALSYPEEFVPSHEDKLKQAIESALSHGDTESLMAALNALADFYDDNDRRVEAEICYLTVLNATKELVGEDHPLMAVGYGRLARHFIKFGNMEMARRSNLKGLTICSHNQKAFPLDYAIALRNQGWLEQSLGDHRRAERRYIKAMKILNTRLRGASALIGLIAYDLGILYLDRHAYLQAERYMNQAVDTLSQQLGDAHPAVSEVLRTYALVLRHNHKSLQASRIESRIKEY